jgi:hypothetical protein
MISSTSTKPQLGIILASIAVLKGVYFLPQNLNNSFHRLYKPNARECALLLLGLIERRDSGREKPMTRVRLAEITLKRLWNRERLTEQFLSDVSDWLLTAGWALFFAGTTYAAVQIGAVENWPAISSKRMSDELRRVVRGQFDFDSLEHLLIAPESARYGDEE